MLCRQTILQQPSSLDISCFHEYNEIHRAPQRGSCVAYLKAPACAKLQLMYAGRLWLNEEFYEDSARFFLGSLNGFRVGSRGQNLQRATTCTTSQHHFQNDLCMVGGVYIIQVFRNTGFGLTGYWIPEASVRLDGLAFNYWILEAGGRLGHLFRV